MRMKRCYTLPEKYFSIKKERKGKRSGKPESSASVKERFKARKPTENSDFPTSVSHCASVEIFLRLNLQLSILILIQFHLTSRFF